MGPAKLDLMSLRSVHVHFFHVVVVRHVRKIRLLLDLMAPLVSEGGDRLFKFVQGT